MVFGYKNWSTGSELRAASKEARQHYPRHAIKFNEFSLSLRSILDYCFEQHKFETCASLSDSSRFMFVVGLTDGAVEPGIGQGKEFRDRFKSDELCLKYLYGKTGGIPA